MGFAEGVWWNSGGNGRRQFSGLGLPCGKPGEQAGKTRRAQRHVALAQLPAQPFEGRDGVVTDAIDRKGGKVGAAHQAGQQCRVMLKTAVMMQEAAVGALDKARQAACA